MVYRMKGTSSSQTVWCQDEGRDFINLSERDAMAIVTVGIDLAKNVFAVHGVDASGKAALVPPSVARGKLMELIASLPPCLIGMEACSGAHHWARLFVGMGHTVRLMAPKFVTPYRMSGKLGKNDAADAAAICEAVCRPTMRFVPLKSVQQQSELLVHRARQGFVAQRTATINRIRGLAVRVRNRAAIKGTDRSPRGNGAVGGSSRLDKHRDWRLAQRAEPS
jgi:transposase